MPQYNNEVIKLKKIYLTFLLMAVVAIAGCVGMPNAFKGIFGPSQPAVEQTPDLLIFSSKGTMPSQPISADTDFTIWTELKSQAEPGSPPLTNVKVSLYDWGLCDVIGNFQPDSTGWKFENNKWTYTFSEFVPNQLERIEFGFRAPDNTRIGNIEADCPIRWQVEYKTSSRSQDDFDIISQSRLRELQRIGESPSWKDQPQYVGIGPVKIYFDWKTPGPVVSGGTIQFSIRVVDKGIGSYGTIDKKTMRLTVPADWKSKEGKEWELGDKPCSKFEVVAMGADIILKNSEPINLINRQTPEIVCTFKAPDLDAKNIPEKSYVVSAEIRDYSYKLMEEQVVHIKPSA